MCICHSITFAEALRSAGESGARDVAALQRRLPLGTGCGMCVAYMQCALETGRTDLPVFDDASMEFWRRRSGLSTEGR